MQLVLDTKGLALKKKDNQFNVVAEKRDRLISPYKVTSIVITKNCLISSAAISLAIDHEIPIFLLDRFGKIKGRLWSASFSGLPMVRKQQALFDDHPDAAAWLADLFLLKTERQLEVLKWIKDNRHTTEKWEKAQQQSEEAINSFQQASEMPLEQAKAKLLTTEAHFAKAYWQALADSLPDGWKFEKRSRRPALDPFNALLNYGYGMLYGVIETATFTAGLDPYMGLLHAEEYQTPSLTFDLIEPFRPWLDLLVVQCFYRELLTMNYFKPYKKGWQLDKPGKAFWIPAFNDWLREKSPDDQGRNTTRQSKINRYAADFALHLKKWKP